MFSFGLSSLLLSQGWSNKHSGLSLFFQVGANVSISIILLLLLLLCFPSALWKNNSFDTGNVECGVDRHRSVLMGSVSVFISPRSLTTLLFKHNLFQWFRSPPFRVDNLVRLKKNKTNKKKHQVLKNHPLHLFSTAFKWHDFHLLMVSGPVWDGVTHILNCEFHLKSRRKSLRSTTSH